jgi:SAM-dependent methyltransferase
VDDRALNAGVRQALAVELAGVAHTAPLAVLEVGAGAGAMLERLLAWDLLPSAEYTAIDLQPENIAEARRGLPESAARCGYFTELQACGDMLLTAGERSLRARLEAIDLFDFIQRQENLRRFDVLIAHAFLDLIDIPAALPSLFRLLRPAGLFYFTVNFDGETILEPSIEPALDGLIMRLYHQTMDQRIVAGRPSGDSHSGRHLFANLTAAGARILAAGASDWVVYPQDHAYPADETYFLHFIIDTIRGALAGHVELDPITFQNWIEARHRQVDAGELVYIAHQLDFLGRAPHD